GVKQNVVGMRNENVLFGQMNRDLLYLDLMDVSIMFWGCFSWDGVGPLVVVNEKMDQDIYVNVLANNLIPWIRNNSNLAFQQDLAPYYLDCQVQKRKPLPSSKNKLIKAIQEEWAKIPLEVLRNLILSMPDQVKAIYKAK
ncbi:2466_t:CDS:2, partial [Dentiscutata heterogama]